MISIPHVSCCDGSSFEVVDGHRFKSGAWDVREILCPRCNKRYRHYSDFWATQSAERQIRKIIQEM